MSKQTLEIEAPEGMNVVWGKDAPNPLPRGSKWLDEEKDEWQQINFPEHLQPRNVLALPIWPERPTAKQLAAWGKVIDGDEPRVPVKGDEWVDGRGDRMCDFDEPSTMHSYNGLRWILKDAPKPEPQWRAWTVEEAREHVGCVLKLPCGDVLLWTGISHGAYYNSEEVIIVDARCEWRWPGEKVWHRCGKEVK